MTPIKIESGRDRASGSGGLMKVSPRPAISFVRRNERPLRRIRDAVDWAYVRFVVAVVATLLVLLHIAMGGGL